MEKRQVRGGVGGWRLDVGSGTLDELGMGKKKAPIRKDMVEAFV